MKEIGGFFELELRDDNAYHSDAIKVNTARNAIEYILKAKRYKKIYIPNYICDSVIEPINKLDLEVEFYSLDDKLELKSNFNEGLSNNESLLYINYFGLKDSYVKMISNKYENLIIDNSQAFYSEALPKVDTVYSPRKFFGVPDGGYLYTVSNSGVKLEQDLSYMKFSSLLKRIDLGAEQAYEDYRSKEASLRNNKLRKMSKVTKKILKSIDYDSIKEKREKNFSFLHGKLKKINEISSLIETDEINGPMIYPLLISKEGIREKLIEKKIFVATYWRDALKRMEMEDVGSYFTRYLIPLPIDQRYGIEDMKIIIKKIIEFI